MVYPARNVELPVVFYQPGLQTPDLPLRFVQLCRQDPSDTGGGSKNPHHTAKTPQPYVITPIRNSAIQTAFCSTGGGVASADLINPVDDLWWQATPWDRTNTDGKKVCAMMPPSRRKSCLACVQSKRKCDKGLPKCQRCLAKKTDCEYNSRLREIPGERRTKMLSLRSPLRKYFSMIGNCSEVSL